MSPAADTRRMYHHKLGSKCLFAKVHTSRGGEMMLQLCTMPTAHYDNAVWVPMPIVHPKNWLPVVEIADLSHTAHGAPP